jgi:hypothetical protein
VHSAVRLHLHGDEEVCKLVCLCIRHLHLTSTPPPPSSPAPPLLTFPTATKEALDDHVMSIGIPAFIKQDSVGDAVEGKKYYFMTIDVAGACGRGGVWEGRSGLRKGWLILSHLLFRFPASLHLASPPPPSLTPSVPPSPLAGSQSSTSSNTSLQSSLMGTHSSSVHMEGLEIRHLLGKGSFGSVYYGHWFGAPVAVSVDEGVWGRGVETRGSLSCVSLPPANNLDPFPPSFFPPSLFSGQDH